MTRIHQGNKRNPPCYVVPETTRPHDTKSQLNVQYGPRFAAATTCKLRAITWSFPATTIRGPPQFSPLGYQKSMAGEGNTVILSDINHLKRRTKNGRTKISLVVTVGGDHKHQI